MTRGDVVSVTAPGDFGKPRPAIVVQSDLFNETHPSVSICLVTSELRDTPIFRITVEPSPSNGLRKLSQVQIDKLVTVRRDRIGKTIGKLEEDLMLRVNRALALWLGLA